MTRRKENDEDKNAGSNGSTDRRKDGRKAMRAAAHTKLIGWPFQPENTCNMKQTYTCNVQEKRRERGETIRMKVLSTQKRKGNKPSKQTRK